MLIQQKWLVTHSLSGLKKISSWVTVDPVKDMHQAPTNQLKLYAMANIEYEAWPTIVQLKRKS